jgi:hypothetical protein
MGTATFSIWNTLFMLAGYTSLLVCLYACYRIYLVEGWQWGAANVLILALFLLLYWLLESWAGTRTPYFSYLPPPAGGFPDWIKFFPWSPPLPVNKCQIVLPKNQGIPISVLLLEATLTFAAMHTALLLARDHAFRLLRPFMAAVPVLSLDLLLDPVSSESFHCLYGNGALAFGLGFWEWYVPPALGPDAFGVPLFNYAVWYAAPVALIALIGLIGWFRDALFEPIRLLAADPWVVIVFVVEGAFLAIIVFAFTIIIMMSPNYANLPVYYLRFLLVSIVIGSLLLVLAFYRFYNYANELRWWFVYPQAAFLLFSLVALVGSGLLAKMPLLGLVALVVAPFFLLWMLSPYLKKIWP